MFSNTLRITPWVDTRIPWRMERMERLTHCEELGERLASTDRSTVSLDGGSTSETNDDYGATSP
jgi:hypothetical protein